MEQRRCVAAGAQLQHQGREMSNEDQMGQAHQGAADAASLQIGQAQGDRVHEGPASVQHGQALQPAADAQGDEVQQQPCDRQPEVQQDQARIRPFALDHAGHHEVDAAEEHHGDKAIEPEMGMRHRVVGEMGDGVDAAQGLEGTLHRRRQIHGSTEGHEAQGGRMPQGPVAALEGQCGVDRESQHGHQHHHALHDGQGDQPLRYRTADQVMAPDLTIEEGQRPEAQQRQVVGLHGPAEHLRHEVIDRGQGQWRVEQAQHIVAIPPVHGGLAHACMHVGQLGHQVQDGKPEQGRTPMYSALI
eukprot:Opistho-2@80241